MLRSCSLTLFILRSSLDTSKVQSDSNINNSKKLARHLKIKSQTQSNNRILSNLFVVF